ncbi:hypothetical protein INT43_001994 [Umbelopsis isabellina]|uniref:BD-FAE-like domain-containing protein n=1 Tax=Mortierella isabellina TaxID=91625 RepID=A0A8H7PRI4_MORIS|nr:hypothetical protein INT43_001994 [Umbelopsis isabellina]
MVAIIAALAATLLIRALPQYTLVTEVIASLFSDLPLHHLALKVAFIFGTKLFGGFRYTLARFAYYIDLLNVVASFAVFAWQFRGREKIEDELSKFGSNKIDIPDLASLQQIKRMALPFIKNDGIILYPNITYANREEALEAVKLTNDYDQPRKMMLDVYAPAQKPPGLRPVLVHIHGGAWRHGNKNMVYPYENDLITEEKWIVVNIGYRLAPVNAYPTHLKDVKRSLRWIKQCIDKFGGDPNFVVLAGDSAGGHLAMMAAMTANEARYQEGFEDVDTSVRGVVSLNGVLRTHIDKFFARKVVMMKGPLDQEFLQEHSPATYCQKAHEKGNLVPSLVLVGQCDNLVIPEGAREFTKQYRIATGEEKGASSACSYVEIPGGHHAFYAAWGARSVYSAAIILSWCRELHNKNK